MSSSSSNVQRSHRDLYKARTPPWKETYRKRCLDRLRCSREKVHDRFRNLPSVSNNDTFIESLMREEWESLKKEQEGMEEGDYNGQEAVDDWVIDNVLDMFEDIQAELRKEELRLLEEHNQYLQSLHLEEESLCSAIDKLSTDEVICPMCKKYSLLTNKSVIFCKCGLRIDTEQDCLTLANVKLMLDYELKQHGERCDCEPIYNVMSAAGISNLLMTCPDCDWMSVVI